MYYLWYDNGANYYDCEGQYETLDGAISAAKSGWQTKQHISTDPHQKEIIWRNYEDPT